MLLREILFINNTYQCHKSIYNLYDHLLINLLQIQDGIRIVFHRIIQSNNTRTLFIKCILSITPIIYIYINTHKYKTHQLEHQSSLNTFHNVGDLREWNLSIYRSLIILQIKTLSLFYSSIYIMYIYYFNQLQILTDLRVMRYILLVESNSEEPFQ